MRCGMMIVWSVFQVVPSADRSVANEASSPLALLNHPQGRRGWKITSKWQFELRDQMHQGHPLGDSHDGFHVGNALIQRSIAMGAVLFTVEAGRNDRSPERVVAQGLQPLFDIFIGLETVHASIVPNLMTAMQI